MSLVVNTGAAARASQAPQAQQPTSGTSPITPQTRSASRSSAAHGSRAGAPGTSTSQHPRGSGAPQPQPTVQKPSPEAVEPEDSRWAANFWVTLVDPQVRRKWMSCLYLLTRPSDSKLILCLSGYGRLRLGAPPWKFCVSRGAYSRGHRKTKPPQASPERRRRVVGAR